MKQTSANNDAKPFDSPSKLAGRNTSNDDRNALFSLIDEPNIANDDRNADGE